MIPRDNVWVAVSPAVAADMNRPHPRHPDRAHVDPTAGYMVREITGTTVVFFDSNGTDRYADVRECLLYSGWPSPEEIIAARST